MPLKRLDHVNLRTTRLAEMIAWYDKVLGMKVGERPDFPFGGAWLYCEGFPIVHLVEVERPAAANGTPQLEHFAISADGLDAFLGHLRESRVGYRCAVLPGMGIQQVNIFDPDGNHIHVDFAKDEKADITDWQP